MPAFSARRPWLPLSCAGRGGYEVTGNNYYSANTITTWIENDRLSFNTLAILAEYNLTDPELPAGVERLHVSLKNPWTVKVQVEEKEMVGIRAL